MRPSVSIIVLNWNGCHHLEACFTALAAQTWRDFETILVDNASQDDSVAFVRKRFPWVRLVVLQENRGFPGGNAAGLAMAQGKEIVLLNNDTRPEPDWLEHLHACAVVHPEAATIASHLVDWEGGMTDSAGDGCRVTGRGYGRHRRQPVKSAPASGIVFGACAGAALYRRELINDIGFLDDDFFLNFEDTDLAFRAQLRGWSAWFCREAVVHHRVSASQGARSAANVYFGARNHLWVCMKNMPGRLLCKYAPLIVFEILAHSVAAARYGRLLCYLRGLAAGLGGTPRMWKKRKAIQRARVITPRQINMKLTRLNLTWSAVSRLLRTT